MKKIGLILSILLLSSAGFAQATSQKLSCSAYKYDVVDDALGDAHLLTQAETPAFPVGGSAPLYMPLPAPYENLAVIFNAFEISYGQDQNQNFLPYIQAFFYEAQAQNLYDIKDVSFNITQLETDDKITLRGYYRVSDDAMLTYICDLVAL